MFFQDIIGQEEIKRQLRHAVLSGRISHAQLFVGDTGFGGLALALAYAQYLFCTGEKQDEACGVCPSCKKMQKLIHPDLHFVFPVVKSTKIKLPVSDEYLDKWRSMLLDSPYTNLEHWITCMNADENAQALIYTEESEHILRKLSLKSFESDYKVMIIWLPEKMKQECANKLLKIIEEPFANTFFFFVSEHPENIISTILSRVQRINVPPLHAVHIENQLVQKHGCPADRAKTTAHVAAGSWLKAMLVLDQDDETEKNQKNFIKLMRLCWERNMVKVNEFVLELTKLSREKQKDFLTHCIRMIRENFVKNLGIDHIVYMTEEEKKFSEKFSPYIHEGNIIPLYDEFEKAHNDIARNGNGKIIFTDLCIKVMQNIRP